MLEKGQEGGEGTNEIESFSQPHGAGLSSTPTGVLASNSRTNSDVALGSTALTGNLPPAGVTGFVIKQGQQRPQPNHEFGCLCGGPPPNCIVM